MGFSQNHLSEHKNSCANAISRNINADIIRLFALFSVVALHFFNNIGFNHIPIKGLSMFVMIAFRSSFMTCVPLFLLLTGSLMNRKRYDKTYYKRIWKTVSMYLLIGILTVIFLYFYKGNTDIVSGLLNIFAFDFSYVWYVEMYIGLFILIPFLNVLYHGLDTQKKKQILILTLIVLCALPSVVNTWNIASLSWWKKPSASANYHRLIPDYWQGLWPLLYYFLGCYISEYSLNLSRKQNLLFIITTFFIYGGVNFYRTWGANYVWADWNEYFSLFTVIQSVLIFNLLSNINFPDSFARHHKVLKNLSDWTFGGYLCSYIIDTVFYEILNRTVPSVMDRAKYFLLIVPAVYICSLLLSAVLGFLSALISKMFSSKKSPQ